MLLASRFSGGAMFFQSSLGGASIGGRSLGGELSVVFGIKNSLSSSGS